MYRVLFVTLFSAALLPAQNTPEQFTALRQTADQKTQAWDALAKSLETKIRALLPCDPKITASVEEVSQASDARLTAFNDYFRALLADSSARASWATRLLEYQTKAGTEFLETEHAETVEERAGTEFQISQTAANLGRKPELSDAESSLRAVAALTDQRNLVMVQQSTRADSLSNTLRTFESQSAIAETAMKALVAAHAAEAERWRAYYAARLARAQAECTAINPGASRPRVASARAGTGQAK